MKRTIAAAALCVPVFLVGCATGPAPIGPDTYMVSDTGAWSWSSGAALKAGLYKEASDFCEGQGKVALPVNSTQNNGDMAGTFAHAELDFKCVARNDPALH